MRYWQVALIPGLDLKPGKHGTGMASAKPVALIPGLGHTLLHLKHKTEECL